MRNCSNILLALGGREVSLEWIGAGANGGREVALEI